MTIAIAIFFTVLLSYAYTVEENYSPLILDVHAKYETSCVFLLHSNYDSLEEMYQLHSSLMQFSRSGSLALTMDFLYLNDSLEFYRQRIVRPLFVTLLNSKNTLADFSRVTESLDMSFPVWLLIFAKNLRSYYQNDYNKDDENTFHLRFDTEMLVCCHNNNTLQEWYALGNKTKMHDLATWEPNTGLIMKTNKTLYQRRWNLENSTLTMTTVANPPLATYNNGVLDGLFGSVMEELSREMNANLKYIPPKEQVYGSWNAIEGRWTGMMELLSSARVDIGVAEFTMTTNRLAAVDFTLPIISSRDKLYIRKPFGGIRWSGYFQAFSPGVWTTMGSLVLVAPVLLTSMKILRKRGRNISQSLIVENFLHVIGICCQQGLSEFPGDDSLRVAYFSLFVSALVLSAAYSASLISYLTTSPAALQFSTLQGFAEDGSYGLTVFPNSAEYDMFRTSTNPVLSKMWSLMKKNTTLPRSLLEGFQQVCDERVALYVAEALKDLVNINIPCDVVSIETERITSLAMALSKHSSYYKLIDYHLRRFRDTGILDRLMKIYATESNRPESTHDQVSLWGIAPILAVLAGGAILGIFILSVEIVHFHKHDESQVGKRHFTMNDNDVMSFGRKAGSLNKHKHRRQYFHWGRRTRRP